MALTRAGGAFDVALATTEVITPVIAEINASSATGGIEGVVHSLTSSFPSSGVVIVAGAMIQPP